MIIIDEEPVKRMEIVGGRMRAVKKAYLGDDLMYQFTVSFYTDRKYTKDDARRIYFPKEEYEILSKFHSGAVAKINDYPEIPIKGFSNNGYIIFRKKISTYEWFPEVLEAGAKIVVKAI